jgi:cytochrome c biogenesis protein CcmG, thiol:disulfide interchange protein DsbE
MKKRTRLSDQNRFSFLSLLVLVVCTGWIWFSRVKPVNTAQGNISAPRQGFRAPAFILDTNTGVKFSLADQNDKIYLINFWTTWCPPCRAEMPAIQQIYTDYQNDGLVVLGINATDQDDLSAAKSFVADNQLSFPILFDLDGEVSRQYNLHSLPTSYFIDQNGIIRDVVVGGPMAEALLRTRIERMLEGSK